MKKLTNFKASILLALCSMLLLGVIYCVSDVRLLTTYMDYSLEHYLMCSKCGAFGVLRDDLIYHVVRGMTPEPRSLCHIRALRKWFMMDVLYEPRDGCAHVWDCFTPSQCDVWYSDRNYYNLPAEFGVSYNSANDCLVVLIVPAMLCVMAVAFRKNERSVRRLKGIALMIAMGSLSYALYACLKPIGTPATDLLSRLRRVRHMVDHRKDSSPNRSEVAYLLSDQAILDCARLSEYDGREADNRPDRVFPRRLLVKAQARLAAAAARYDMNLSERYFYGKNMPTNSGFCRLMEELSMHHGPRFTTGVSGIASSIESISTNRFGVVLVEWNVGGLRLSGKDGKTFFVCVLDDKGEGGGAHWIPFRNIDQTASTYYWDMYLKSSW